MHALRSFACARALVSMLIAPAAFGQCVIEPCPDLIVEGRYHWLSYGTPIDTMDTDENGIIDHWEVRLFNAVLCDGNHPLHEVATCTLVDNLARWDAESIAGSFVQIRIWAAGSACISASLRSETFATIALMVGQPGHVFASTYLSVLDGVVEPFSGTGDVDGDGESNLQEAMNVAGLGGDESDYLAAALDPLVTGSECTVTLETCPDLVGQVRQIRSLNFGTPEDAHDEDSSGILDSWELALFNAALCDDQLPFNQDLVCAFHRNYTRWSNEIETPFNTEVAQGVAALLTMGTVMRDGVVEEVASMWFPLEFTYEAFEISGAEPFSAGGDFDGDSATNAQEYANVKSVGGTLQDYVEAAMDATLDGTECTGFVGPCPNYEAEGMELYSVWFLLDWETGDLTYDGIPDKWQAAMFADALCSPDTSLDNLAGCAFRRNLVTLRQEQGLNTRDYDNLLAVLLTISSETRDAIVYRWAMTGDYEVVTSGAKSPNEPFSAEGDLDGDGYTNLDEYQNTVGAGLSLASFVRASQDPLLDGSKDSDALPLGRWSVVIMIGALVFVWVFKRGEWEMRV